MIYLICHILVKIWCDFPLIQAIRSHSGLKFAHKRFAYPLDHLIPNSLIDLEVDTFPFEFIHDKLWGHAAFRNSRLSPSPSITSIALKGSSTFSNMLVTTLMSIHRALRRKLELFGHVDFLCNQFDFIKLFCLDWFNKKFWNPNGLSGSERG